MALQYFNFGFNKDIIFEMTLNFETNSMTLRFFNFEFEN